VPEPPESRTGGYIYDRRIVDGLRETGWAVDVHAIDDSFPRPTTEAIAHAAEVLAALSGGTITLIDSLALGAIPEIVERHASRLRIVALVHLPLAADIGIAEADSARFAAERRTLAAATRVIDRAGRCRCCSARCAVSPIAVTRHRSRATGSRVEGVAASIAVGDANPGRDTRTCWRHWAVPSRDWRLTCAGSLTRHPVTTTRIHRSLRAGVDDRVSLAES
jgi:hypothetical protein